MWTQKPIHLQKQNHIPTEIKWSRKKKIQWCAKMKGKLLINVCCCFFFGHEKMHRHFHIIDRRCAFCNFSLFFFISNLPVSFSNGAFIFWWWLYSHSLCLGECYVYCEMNGTIDNLLMSTFSYKRHLSDKLFKLFEYLFGFVAGFFFWRKTTFISNDMEWIMTARWLSHVQKKDEEILIMCHNILL